MRHCTSEVHANGAAHFPRIIEPHGCGRDTPQGKAAVPAGARSAVSGDALLASIRGDESPSLQSAGGNDRYVIDLNTGKLHLCNAKNAIVVCPKLPIVSVRMNLQSGTASMLTPSGRCYL
jgi:hypothetical protein